MTIGPSTPRAGETATAMKKRHTAEKKSVRHRCREINTAEGDGFVDGLQPVPTPAQLAQIFDGANGDKMWVLQNAIRRWGLRMTLVRFIECYICKKGRVDDANGHLKQHNGVRNVPAYASHHYVWICTCARNCVPTRTKPAGRHIGQREVLVCDNCSRDISKGNHPTFSEANCIYFPQQNPMYDHRIPNCNLTELLPPLTLKEIALIQRISPIMSCKSLKYGNRVVSGHVALVENGIDIIATILPRLGSECAWIIVRVGDAEDYIEFRVRREVVEMWLIYLTTYSPAYRGVVIDMTRIPASGVVEGVRVVVTSPDGDSAIPELLPAVATPAAVPAARSAPATSPHSPLRDDGPAPGQLVPNNATTYSGMYQQGHVVDAVTHLREQRAGLVGESVLAAGCRSNGVSSPLAHSVDDGVCVSLPRRRSSTNSLHGEGDLYDLGEDSTSDADMRVCSPRRRSSTNSLNDEDDAYEIEEDMRVCSPRRRSSTNSLDGDDDADEIEEESTSDGGIDDATSALVLSAERRAVPFLTHRATGERTYVSMQRGKRLVVWCWNSTRRTPFRLDKLLQRRFQDAFALAATNVPLQKRATVYHESISALRCMRDCGDGTFERFQPQTGGQPILPNFGDGVRLANHFPAALQRQHCQTLLQYFAVGIRSHAMENGALFGKRSCSYVNTYSAEVIAGAMYVAVRCASWDVPTLQPDAILRRRRRQRSALSAAASDAAGAGGGGSRARRSRRRQRPLPAAAAAAVAASGAGDGEAAAVVDADDVHSDEYVAPMQERRITAFVDQETVAYAWAMTYPNLFLPDHNRPLPQKPGEEPHSLCEIPSDFTIMSSRGKQPRYSEWVSWVFSAGNGAIARHPVARFALLNLLRRSQALKQGHYSLKTGEDSRSMTLDELKEKVANGDNSFLHKIQCHQQNVTGTPQFWQAKRNTVTALVRDMYYTEDQVCIAFHTGSCAEYHANDLHRLLQRVLTTQAKTDVQRRIAATLLDGSTASKAALHRAVRDHQHIVTAWFEIRTTTWFNGVLREGLGVTDFWGRYEFAKSRGAIHFHAILYAVDMMSELSPMLDAAASALDQDALTTALATAAVVVNDFATSIGMTALHPAGESDSDPRADVTQWYLHEAGKDEDAAPPRGNLAFWPAPEGTMPKPPKNVLQAVQYFLAAGDYSMDLVHLVNRILLHSCSLYCWKEKRKKKKKTPAPASATGDAAAAPPPPPRRRTKHEDCTPDECFEPPCDCRVGMGPAACPKMHPWTKKTRTLGKKLQEEATLEMERGVLKLNQQRNHPRLVQGMLSLVQAWRANMDFQIVLCAAMVPTIIQLLDGMNTLSEQEKERARETLLKLRSANQWMCPEATMQRIVDYVVAYSTKASATSGEMFWIFQNLLNDAESTTSVASFASKFICGVLKKLEVTSQEAAHQLAGVPLTLTSRNRKIVSLAGSRTVRAARDGDDRSGAAQLAQDNDFDKFCKRPDTESAISFDAWLRGQLKVRTEKSRIKSNGVDRFTWQRKWFVQYVGKPTRVSIPLNAAFCEGALMRYRPHIRSVADAVAPFPIEESEEEYEEAPDDGMELEAGDDDMVDGAQMELEAGEENAEDVHPVVGVFIAFLDRDECPAKLKKDYFLEKDRTQANVSLAPQDGATVSQSQTQPEANDPHRVPDLDLIHRIMGNVVVDPAARLAQLNTGDDATDWVRAGQVGDAVWSNSIDGKLDSVIAQHQAGLLSDMSLGAHSPTLAMNNDEQRFLLSIVLLHLKCKYDAATSDPDVDPLLRLVLLGIAGTGKSFCIRTMVDFVTMITLDPASADVIAPTGAAAFNCNGSTSQRSLGFNSTSVYKKLSLAKKAALQSKRESTVLQCADELSMYGCGQFAMVVHRLGDLQNRGQFANSHPCSCGMIPALAWCGDIMQMGPVLDVPLYKTIPSRSNNEETCKLIAFGQKMYELVSRTVIELTQPVRQQAGSELAAELFKLRCELGPTTAAEREDALQFWNARSLPFLGDEEKRRFEDPTSNVVYAAYANATVAKGNREYLTHFDLVLIAAQVATGRHTTQHANSKIGMAKAIPLRLELARGALVKLTLNLLAELGLHNGARGNVVGWRYANPSTAVRGTLPSTVIVNFPAYDGPPLCVFSRFALLTVAEDGSLVLPLPSSLAEEKPVLPDSAISPAEAARAEDIVARLRRILLAALAANDGDAASDRHVAPGPLHAAVEQWAAAHATTDMSYVDLGSVEAFVNIDGSSTVSVELLFCMAPGARATWVPIPSVQRRCDCGGCDRVGFPLKVAKHTTLHGLQGLEVRKGGAMTGLVVDITPGDEANNPGITYVALSRIETIDLLALTRSLTHESLEKLCSGARYEMRTGELERLRRNKVKTAAKYKAVHFGGDGAAHAIGSKQAYCDLLTWLVTHSRAQHTGKASREAALVLERCDQIEAELASLAQS
jgi:hypothetical protein